MRDSPTAMPMATAAVIQWFFQSARGDSRWVLAISTPAISVSRIGTPQRIGSNRTMRRRLPLALAPCRALRIPW